VRPGRSVKKACSKRWPPTFQTGVNNRDDASMNAATQHNGGLEEREVLMRPSQISAGAYPIAADADKEDEGTEHPSEHDGHVTTAKSIRMRVSTPHRRRHRQRWNRPGVAIINAMRGNRGEKTRASKG
jgi:hypothetical protein